MSAQSSFLTLAKTKTLRREKFLSEMAQVIPWTDLIQAVRPHYFDNEVDRPARDILLMLKIYFLQQWFNLGDSTVED